MLKALIPNIVMIDDVDQFRCTTIWTLNNLAEQQLQEQSTGCSRVFSTHGRGEYALAPSVDLPSLWQVNIPLW